MVYPYITLADGTEIVHTDIIEKEDGQHVEVNFERPSDNCFDTARCDLPTYQWIVKTGYSDDEIKEFEELLRHNAHLIYR
ncbi:MAG: hypothetical protein RR403_06495, partial [Pseudoflavonifractor sp.]